MDINLSEVLEQSLLGDKVPCGDCLGAVVGSVSSGAGEEPRDDPVEVVRAENPPEEEHEHVEECYGHHLESQSLSEKGVFS